MVLKYEINEYTDKNGEKRQAVNFFVEIDAGAVGMIKVQLRPTDYTGKELLEKVLVK